MLLVPYILYYIYILRRQMYTFLCYVTQFLLNAVQHVSSLYKAHSSSGALSLQLQQLYYCYWKVYKILKMPLDVPGYWYL
jgi:hypothetical protein